MPGNYTVFAPTDAAFAALGDVNLSQDELKAILLYHVVNDRLTRDQLATDDRRADSGHQRREAGGDRHPGVQWHHPRHRPGDDPVMRSATAPL